MIYHSRGGLANDYTTNVVSCGFVNPWIAWDNIQYFTTEQYFAYLHLAKHLFLYVSPSVLQTGSHWYLSHWLQPPTIWRLSWLSHGHVPSHSFLTPLKLEIAYATVTQLFMNGTIIMFPSNSPELQIVYVTLTTFVSYISQIIYNNEYIDK